MQEASHLAAIIVSSSFPPRVAVYSVGNPGSLSLLGQETIIRMPARALARHQPVYPKRASCESIILRNRCRSRAITHFRKFGWLPEQVGRTAVLARGPTAVSGWPGRSKPPLAPACPGRGPTRPDWPAWRPQTDDSAPKPSREFPAPASRAARPWRIVPARGKWRPDCAEPWPSVGVRG